MVKIFPTQEGEIKFGALTLVKFGTPAWDAMVEKERRDHVKQKDVYDHSNTLKDMIAEVVGKGRLRI